MENQMVKVFENKEYEEFQLVPDSREVAEMVGMRHDHLIRNIDHYIGVMGKNPKLGASNFFIERTYKQAGNGKEVKRYDITKKGCEMVANKLTGEKGILFTAEYVERFNQMEKQQNGTTITLPDFTNPVEAARAWADEYEAKQKLLVENKAMLPKAEFYDAVANTESLVSMGDVAKTLDIGIGRNKLYKFLRDKKVLMSDNIPYQLYVDRGYFKVVESYYMVGENKVIAKTTYVKQKGVDYIRKLLTTGKSIVKVQ